MLRQQVCGALDLEERAAQRHGAGVAIGDDDPAEQAALLEPGQRATAGLYLLGSLVVGLAAVWAGMVAARVLVRLARRSRRQTEHLIGADTDTTIARRTS